MKITMGQAVSIYELKGKIQNLEIPIRVAYTFSVLFSTIQKEYDFYKSEFKKIVDEFAQRDENGNYRYSNDGASISIMSGREVECQSKLEELSTLIVTAPDVHFNLKDLESMSVNMNEMEALMPFIIQ